MLQFGECLLKAELVRSTAAPDFVGWVRRFLSRPASDESLGKCEGSVRTWRRQTALEPLDATSEPR